MERRMLRIALLGAGRIGRVHARSIVEHPESTLVALSDVFAVAADTLAAETGAAVSGVDEILADASIDAVLVATSTDTHADLVERASASGKAVLCEKPVDLSLERALACQRATATATAPIMVGFNRRFDPSFSTLRQAYDAGEIGKGELLSITSFDPAPPPLEYVRVSGGLFRDMMIHDIDIACWLFGSTPTRVTAVGTCTVDPAIGDAGDVDTAVATLAWEDGRLAVIRNSRRAAYGYDQRIELLGSDGMLAAANELENTVQKLTAAGQLSAKPEYFFLERYARAFRREWDTFVQAVLAARSGNERDDVKGSEGGNAPLVSLQDGINALAVAEAATESRRTGRTIGLSGTTLETAGA